MHEHETLWKFALMSPIFLALACLLHLKKLDKFNRFSFPFDLFSPVLVCFNIKYYFVKEKTNCWDWFIVDSFNAGNVIFHWLCSNFTCDFNHLIIFCVFLLFSLAAMYHFALPFTSLFFFLDANVKRKEREGKKGCLSCNFKVSLSFFFSLCVVAADKFMNMNLCARLFA